MSLSSSCATDVIHPGDKTSDISASLIQGVSLDYNPKEACTNFSNFQIWAMSKRMSCCLSFFVFHSSGTPVWDVWKKKHLVAFKSRQLEPGIKDTLHLGASTVVIVLKKNIIPFENSTPVSLLLHTTDRGLGWHPVNNPKVFPVLTWILCSGIFPTRCVYTHLC